MDKIIDAHGNEYTVIRKKKSKGMLEHIIDGIFMTPLEKAISAGINKGEALAQKGMDATCKQLDKLK